MLSATLFGTLGLALLAVDAHGANLATRQTNEEANLGSFYAYGESIDGLPIFWSDETAFIGLEPPPEAAVATNVTCEYHCGCWKAEAY